MKFRNALKGFHSHLGWSGQFVVAMRFLRKVNERGVLTLPSEIREALDVGEGDIVEFEVLRVVKKSTSPSRGPVPSVPGAAE